MKPRIVKEHVCSVGAVDWDRRLFDELIPLPDGTSYNAYLIRANEKTVLIDTVDPTMTNMLMGNLDELNIKSIDYVIVNHAEQDHSGALPAVLSRFPNAIVVCTPKCKPLLVELLLIPERKIKTVEDGETISLGDKTLEFIHAPWVHWPETMFTYLRDDRILFTCDFFGSHYATSDLFVTNEAIVYEAAKRYYAEIMMPFRAVIPKHLERIKPMQIDIIATSHGPIYDKPEFIIDAYKDWVLGEPKNIVVLPYISMHGSTRAMVKYFVDALAEKGVAVKQFDLARTDIGKLAMALVDAATIVIGTPQVLFGVHPNVAYAVFLANVLHPKLKFASVIASYGWGGKMLEQITAMLPNLRLELIPPVVIKGYPKEDDYKALDGLAETIFNKHKENNIL
jgi:flavorubredoxin